MQGVSDNIDMTIAATDLSKENDWAKYSAGQLVDPPYIIFVVKDA